MPTSKRSAAGPTTGPRTATCRSEDENGRCNFIVVLDWEPVWTTGPEGRPQRRAMWLQDRRRRRVKVCPISECNMKSNEYRILMHSPIYRLPHLSHQKLPVSQRPLFSHSMTIQMTVLKFIILEMCEGLPSSSLLTSARRFDKSQAQGLAWQPREFSYGRAV